TARAQLAFAFPRGLGERGRTAPDEPWQEAVLDAMFAHFGQCFVEALLIDRLVEQDLSAPAEALQQLPTLKHVSSSGEEVVYRILDSGRGGLALSGHLGSIDLLAAYHIRCGVPLSVVGRVPNYPWLAALLEEIRTGYGAKTIWREDPRAGRTLVRSLKNGEFVAALIDQDTKLESAFAPFFGLPAASPVALLQLAIRTKVPIVSSFIYRTAPEQHFVVTEELLYDDNDPDAAEKILAEFNLRLERLLERYPEQWPWWHRRWRRRPGVDYEQHPDRLPSRTEYLRWLEAAPSDTSGAVR
ncbi:MAG: lysophospholipid acyltransferase family protein, partial [Bdellovibrionales bacterium]|nr:lysophospholipid acyltransferase family protein [Bdellovibrionales bacterium]